MMDDPGRVFCEIAKEIAHSPHHAPFDTTNLLPIHFQPRS